MLGGGGRENWINVRIIMCIDPHSDETKVGCSSNAQSGYQTWEMCDQSSEMCDQTAQVGFLHVGLQGGVQKKGLTKGGEFF